MTRINTNIPALMAAMYMNRNSNVLNTALERLSSGLRINNAGDDPQGIITTDALRGELTGIASAIGNAERANNMLATADGSMANISELLLKIKQTVIEVSSNADLTNEELKNKQVEIDNDIQAINNVVGAATFAGQKLLDGSLGYNTSGVNAAAISDMNIFRAPVGTTSDAVAIKIDLTQQARKGELVFAHATVASNLKVRLTGPAGNETLTFAAGTTSTQIVQSIQGLTEKTGLTAALVNAGDPTQGVRIQTQDYGSAADVMVEVTQGNAADFALVDRLGAAATRSAGVDVGASVNGVPITGDGLNLHYVSASMDFETVLQAAWNQAGPPATTSFHIDSGGALFQIGSHIGADQQTSFGLAAIDAAHLGTAALGYLGDMLSGGTLELRSGNTAAMAKIVDAASAQVAQSRGRIGSFQNNSLGMAINNLKQAQESISTARSSLLDTDYAAETALLSRQQILVQATQSAMALANQMPQTVLSLLKG